MSVIDGAVPGMREPPRPTPSLACTRAVAAYMLFRSVSALKVIDDGDAVSPGVFVQSSAAQALRPRVAKDSRGPSIRSRPHNIVVTGVISDVTCAEVLDMLLPEPKTYTGIRYRTLGVHEASPPVRIFSFETVGQRNTALELMTNNQAGLKTLKIEWYNIRTELSPAQVRHKQRSDSEYDHICKQTGILSVAIDTAIAHTFLSPQQSVVSSGDAFDECVDFVSRMCAPSPPTCAPPTVPQVPQIAPRASPTGSPTPTAAFSILPRPVEPPFTVTGKSGGHFTVAMAAPPTTHQPLSIPPALHLTRAAAAPPTTSSNPGTYVTTSHDETTRTPAGSGMALPGNRGPVRGATPSGATTQPGQRPQTSERGNAGGKIPPRQIRILNDARDGLASMRRGPTDVPHLTTGTPPGVPSASPTHAPRAPAAPMPPTPPLPQSPIPPLQHRPVMTGLPPNGPGLSPVTSRQHLDVPPAHDAPAGPHAHVHTTPVHDHTGTPTSPTAHPAHAHAHSSPDSPISDCSSGRTPSPNNPTYHHTVHIRHRQSLDNSSADCPAFGLSGHSSNIDSYTSLSGSGRSEEPLDTSPHGMPHPRRHTATPQHDTGSLFTTATPSIDIFEPAISPDSHAPTLHDAHDDIGNVVSPIPTLMASPFHPVDTSQQLPNHNHDLCVMMDHARTPVNMSLLAPTPYSMVVNTPPDGNSTDLDPAMHADVALHDLDPLPTPPPSQPARVPPLILHDPPSGAPIHTHMPLIPPSHTLQHVPHTLPKDTPARARSTSPGGGRQGVQEVTLQHVCCRGCGSAYTQAALDNHRSRTKKASSAPGVESHQLDNGCGKRDSMAPLPADSMVTHFINTCQYALARDRIRSIIMHDVPYASGVPDHGPRIIHVQPVPPLQAQPNSVTDCQAKPAPTAAKTKPPAQGAARPVSSIDLDDLIAKAKDVSTSAAVKARAASVGNHERRTRTSIPWPPPPHEHPVSWFWRPLIIHSCDPSTYKAPVELALKYSRFEELRDAIRGDLATRGITMGDIGHYTPFTPYLLVVLCGPGCMSTTIPTPQAPGGRRSPGATIASDFPPANLPPDLIAHALAFTVGVQTGQGEGCPPVPDAPPLCAVPADSIVRSAQTVAQCTGTPPADEGKAEAVSVSPDGTL